MNFKKQNKSSSLMQLCPTIQLCPKYFASLILRCGKILCLLPLFFLIASCASLEEFSSEYLTTPHASSGNSSQTNSLTATDTSALTAPNVVGASEGLATLLKQAQQLPSPEQEKQLLKATQIAIGQQRWSEADLIHSVIHSTELKELPGFLYFYHRFGAEIDLQMDRLADAKVDLEALDLLTSNESLLLNADQTNDFAMVYAQYYLKNGDPKSALIKLLTSMDAALAPERIQQTNDLIWQAMRLATVFDLAELESAAVPNTFPINAMSTPQATINQTELEAWLDLLKCLDQPNQNQISQNIVSQNKSSQSQTCTLSDWKQKWSNSLAASHPPSILGVAPTFDDPDFELIGVLLPRSGNFTDAAEKILRGILIAHYDYMQKFPNSSIRVYDTEAQGVEAAYQHAIADGADALVGPLEKEQLNALLKLTDIQIPMVALNYSTTPPPATQNTYLEFGLRAEDEAIQLAQYAKTKGYRRAVAMAPETELGSRLNQAFVEEFERQGGIVLDSVSYSKNYKLLSDTVQNILSLQESDKRHKSLQATLNVPISFQPKIRQDADFLALFALPIEARQIKPIIDFYYGQELPILSSSHIYSGVAEPSANADLNQITFVDIPWVLANQEVLTQTFGKNLTDHNQYSRLNALGIDAHLILQHYPQIKSESNFGLQGATGYLSLSNHHQIKRQMSWAQFRKGVAVLLEEQPAVTQDVLSEQQHESLNPVAPVF